LKAVPHVEFSPSLLLDREGVLKRTGFQVISVLGSSNAQTLEASDSAIEIIMIGHGAPWQDGQDPIAQFQKTLTEIPIVALLRSNVDPFGDADFKCIARGALLPLIEMVATQRSIFRLSQFHTNCARPERAGVSAERNHIDEADAQSRLYCGGSGTTRPRLVFGK
jgi:hypothetical protein